MSSITFQDLILTLQNYWASQGCVLMQPYDMEVGGGVRSIQPHSYDRSVQRIGAVLTYSHAAALRMAATAKTRIAISIITNFK